MRSIKIYKYFINDFLNYLFALNYLFSLHRNNNKINLNVKNNEKTMLMVGYAVAVVTIGQVLSPQVSDAHYCRTCPLGVI